MPMIEWTKDLAIGVKQIDQQHQEIFTRVNALLEASSRGDGTDRVAATLQFLATYVVDHFTAEERAMRDAAYPGYADHRKLHAAFLADFEALKGRFQKEGASVAVTLDVQRRVVGWLVHHIRKDDKALGAFLQQRAPSYAM